MVELLVGLKIRLLRRSLAGPLRRRVAVAAVAVVAFLFTAPICVLLLVLGLTDLVIANAMTVLIGVGLMLAWVWLPLFLTGTDDALSPRRFALLPISAGRLLPGLYVAGLIGLGSGLSLLVALSSAIGWSISIPVSLAALGGALLGVVTATLIPHVLTTVFASALGSRRFRDLTGLAVVAFAVALTVLLQLAGSAVNGSQNGDALLAALDKAAGVLSWTPLGAAWALAGDASRGNGAAFLGHLGIALATVAALVLAWWGALRRALTSPVDVPDIVGRVNREGRADAWFSRSRTAVIAGRVFRYYRRDPRRVLSVFSMMLAPVLVGVSVAGMTVAGGRAGGISLLLVAPMLGMLIGPTLAFDISYDDSALWMHITASVRGWEDRLGRLAGFSIVAVPIVTLVLLIGVAASGWEHLVPFAAATIAVTGAALGVGSHLGSVIQVPVPPPGSNPFGKGSGGGPLSIVVSLITVVVALVAASPALVLAFLSYSHGWARVAAVPAAAVIAAAALAWGIVMGGRRLDRRWPEVLAEVTYKR